MDRGPASAERLINRLLIAGALIALAAGLMVQLIGGSWARTVWTVGTLPVVAALAVAILRGLKVGRAGLDTIAFLSMVAALAIGEALAANVVAIMYAGGVALENYAVARAERDLTALIDRAPRVAHKVHGETVEDISVDAIVAGDLLLVRAGEVVPTDGFVEGSVAVLDESAVTGEPMPVVHIVGAAIRSGTTNAGETFRLRASASSGESTYAGILRLVSAAQTAHAPFLRMADRFALLLLPASLLLAGAAWFVSGDMVRGLAVLVAATPCPLILAAPVAFIAGVSQAARLGILVKGGGALEALAQVRTVIFDKTGTLTVGGARLIGVETAPGGLARDVLLYAASLEQASHHIVAQSIVEAARLQGLALSMPSRVRETHGSGLEGLVEGRQVRIGAHPLVFGAAQPEEWALRVFRRASWRSALAVFVSIDGQGVGALLMGDELRREAPRAVQRLRRNGIERILMVTGDRADAAETIGAALDLDSVLADRVPADKADAVASEQRRAPVLMVGDGINDAPALAAAHVGMAMGARGASASSQAADVVLLVDRVDRVADALIVARRTRAIAMQSIVVGMFFSGIAMLAAALGHLTPVEGALVQEGIDIAVILNALRALLPAHVRSTPQPHDDDLHARHRVLDQQLDRLRAIADALDDAGSESAHSLIREANGLVQSRVVEHERSDEASLQSVHRGAYGAACSAMSRAHREILHLARLLDRLSSQLELSASDRYVIRDAQRAIETIESLVRIHNAQEEDIFDHEG